MGENCWKGGKMSVKETKLEIAGFLKKNHRDSLWMMTTYINLYNFLIIFHDEKGFRKLYIKIKPSPTGRLTSAQEKFRTENSRNTSLYLVVFSFKDFLCNYEHFKKGVY